MPEISLSERQQRELEYYTKYAQIAAPNEVWFDPVRGTESRPENEYWYLCGEVARLFKPGDRLLDFGCGPGFFSVMFASVGYETYGFDIAPANVAKAEELARRYNLAERTHFAVGLAEKLDYPSNHFEMVVGVDILHHVDIAQAMAEVRRTLKPGGIAMFKEPVAAPVFDAVRNTRFVKALFPNSASFERHVTEDERKLSRSDIETIRRYFPDISVRHYRLFSRLDKIVGQRRGLYRADHAILRSVPALGRYAGTAVLTFSKPM